jgi:EAL domain-containing protein (putative c-di-GMP-specific phosphodiesterase class I)/ActR/RegA family two-component response regulator
VGPSPEPEDLKILVVDDRASVCELVTRLLAQLGVWRVESAQSGAQALRLIETADEPFHIAIFDLDMPTDDGLVCIRRLARFSVRPSIILMSGKDPVVLESAQRLGEGLGLAVLGTLSKPITGATLTAMLEALKRPAAAAGLAPPVVVVGAEVKTALDEGQFELWFQPQYHVASRRICGVEALLRMRDGRGLLLPNTFIKPAEDGGLMGRLTEFVLEQAVTWCAAWHTAGWPLTVSLNLSKSGLTDLALPDRAATVCKNHGLATSDLTFELTESSLAADPMALLDIMTRLRLKGFRLALDDFGTGYASLEELRSLPFHELKLDMQFVQTAGHNSRSRAILESSVGLAAELHLTTVAEGVESDAMLRMVCELGCQVVQGYFISKPLPAGDVVAWLAQREASGPDLTPTFASAGQRAGAPRSSSAVAADAELAETVLRFAHDVASPMMMVLALSELLLQDGALSATHREDVDQIHRSAKEVAAMLKALQRRVRDSAGEVR